MYNKTIWKDRVVDPVSGAVVQEGTFMSAEHFNNIEDGIAAVDSAIADISGGYEDIEEALETGVGTTVSLTLNQSTFVLNLALKNSKGTKISEQSVDLPIESMIVNAEYVASTKSLVLTLQSGSTVTVPLSGLISGLVNDTRKVAGIDLKDDITVSELKTALDVDDLEQNKVNKTTTVNGRALSSNITLAGSDLKLNATSYTKDSTSKTISKDTKVDEAVAQIEYRVDKKVDKATASTSQYTTSTVTVPACLGYAGVKMVGGKTKKSKNLCEVNTTNVTYKEMNGITFTPVWKDGFLQYINVNGTSTNWAIYSISINPVTASRLSALSTTLTGDAYVQVKYGDDAGAVIKNDGGVDIENTRQVTSVVFTIAPNLTISNVKFKPMLSNDSTDTYYSYEPYGLLNAPVEKIVSKDTNGNVKNIISVPDAIKALPDYGCSVGDVYNLVDFENGVYHHNVGSVDMGTKDWEPFEQHGMEKTYYISLNDIIDYAVDASNVNIICGKYTTVNYSEFYSYGQIESHGKYIQISDDNYADKNAFKTAMNGVKLVYELADSAKKTIPISAFIPPVSCEQGGTITLQNPHSLDVSNKIVFKKEVI